MFDWTDTPFIGGQHSVVPFKRNSITDTVFSKNVWKYVTKYILNSGMLNTQRGSVKQRFHYVVDQRHVYILYNSVQWTKCMLSTDILHEI